MKNLIISTIKSIKSIKSISMRPKSTAKSQFLLTLILIVGLSGCGGGGGGSSVSPVTPVDPISNSNVPFGPAVALQVSEVIPERILPNSSFSTKVFAVDATGKTKDVTSQVIVDVDVPSRLQTTINSDQLTLQYSKQLGAVKLRLQAMGVALEVNTFISAISASKSVEKIALSIGEGYSFLSPNIDGSFSVVPGRTLLIDARAIMAPSFEAINSEVQITSSNPKVFSIFPVNDTGGSALWWGGKSLTPGTAIINVKWSGYEFSQAIHVSPSLVVRATLATQVGITENLSGRSTVYMLLQNGTTPQVLAYSESESNNRWGPVRLIANPDGAISRVSATTVAAEAPNGYRAVVSSNNASLSPVPWVYLISPNGSIVGPITIPDAGVLVLRVVVSANGDANIWFRAGDKVIRKIVRFSTGSQATVNSVQITKAPYFHQAQVAASNDGTVVVNWTDEDCRVHYAFDSIQNSGVISPEAIGSINVEECGANFSNIFTHHNSAAGNGELALILQYLANTDAINTQVFLVNRGGVSSSKLVDRDVGIIAGAPSISMTTSGEFLASWATENRGTWAIPRTSGSAIGTSFLAVAPFASAGTAFVQGVYSRGDGNFVLVWPGGASIARTPLEMRNYSQALGLGPVLSFQNQNSTATNRTSIVATPRGISAVWSFPQDLSVEEVDAIQFLSP